MKEAYLYKQLPDGQVTCQACAHYCVIAPEKRGICGVRKNVKGRLCSLVYGKPCALHVDPIEKKPFFHFLPGTKSLSLATVGCNLACWACQNWQISQEPKISGNIEGGETSPERVVAMALQNKVPSISYTYTEPTVFIEYALDTMKIAKEEGLKNNWVSNGFMSRETLELIAPYLDAANIDLKSFDDEFYREYCGGRLQPVLDTLRRLKEKKIWVEVTTLAVPAINDSEEMFSSVADFIKQKLGEETPWHISRFSGAISWKLQNLPDTPVDTLEQARELGKKAGLKYVYTGNVPGSDLEDTFCPSCGEKMIERDGYSITRHDKDGKCSKCDVGLDLILR